MNNDILDIIQSFFQSSFKILPILGNIPNVIFIIVGVCIFYYWVHQLLFYNK
ncbi:DUF6341 family protein [Ichthyobacterium seriolicida]|uniref:DUF6341 family protein n=1 Tax=Ichthyobacterium seriolicida TaxID=242600 RepID=UPI003743C500